MIKWNSESEAKSVGSAEARRLILEGKAPNQMRVGGHLDLAGLSDLIALPAGLSAYSLNVSDCINLTHLPDDLRIRHLILNRCTALAKLPVRLGAERLEAQATSIQTLPEDLNVRYSIDLQECRALESLPAGMQVDRLNLRGCTALKSLPQGLKAHRLDVSGCTRLTTFPEDISTLIELNVSGCTSLQLLPEGTRVVDGIELASSGLTGLPKSCRRVAIHWRGVQIDERIAFRPESFRIDEILNERNAERRRILIERLGYEAIFEKANAEVLDRDLDAGGERRLMRVGLQDDEPLVCISVRCPSTGRQYVLRVPPQIQTCRHAAAWLAGFDEPEQYDPIIET